MPFTPTHIAAAVPIACLWRQTGIFTGLVIGSMSPDWALYLPIGRAYDVKTIFSIGFVYSVFAGFVMTIVFIGCLRKPLFELLSVGLRRRLSKYCRSRFRANPKFLLSLLLAVFLGATTHVVWDSLTHDGTFAMTLFPGLREGWSITASVQLPGYSVLQHGSTLLFGPILLVAFVRWYLGDNGQPAPERLISDRARYLWLCFMVGIPTALVSIYISELETFTFVTMMNAMYLSSIEVGRSLIVMISLYSLFFFPLIHEIDRK